MPLRLSFGFGPMCLLLVGVIALAAPRPAQAAACDKQCLEQIAAAYRAAYVRHDPTAVPIAPNVRFTENGVVLKFPDGSWDTVTQEVGPALTASDPVTGMIGIYTTIRQHDTPGYLAIRLKVVDGKITEIEHLLSTRRGVSGPPTPFGDIDKLVHDPVMAAPVPPAERMSRADMIALADGYFSTLEKNDGTIKTKFSPDCHRIENGWEAAKSGCEHNFKLGFYAFNERVRDRTYFLVDEDRGLVMARAFIDHKGVITTIHFTDGTERPSVFQEPQTWAVLELFKVRNGMLGPIEADFIGVPYYTPTAWPSR